MLSVGHRPLNICDIFFQCGQTFHSFWLCIFHTFTYITLCLHSVRAVPGCTVDHSMSDLINWWKISSTCGLIVWFHLLLVRYWESTLHGQIRFWSIWIKPERKGCQRDKDRGKKKINKGETKTVLRNVNRRVTFVLTNKYALVSTYFQS